MPGKERPSFHNAKRLIEQTIQSNNERIIHSRLLTPPPLTPNGYTLKLIDNIPSQLTPQEALTAQQKIDRDREKLRRNGAFNPLKVNIIGLQTENGVDNTGQRGQVIDYTTAPAYYFQHRSGIDETTPYETARKLSHAGASLIAITGDNMIVLTSRPDKVQLYPRTFAATASGSWDGQMQSQEPDLLIPPTPDNAVTHIKKELHEEIGLPMDVINAPDAKLIVMGVAEDQIKKHRDILYMLKLPENITSAEMRMFHKEEQINGNGHTDNDPMAGHLMFIPANPLIIANVLTMSRAPWDATARTTLLMTGYMLKMQEYLDKGLKQDMAVRKAKRWMQFTEWRTALNQSINIDFQAKLTRGKKIRRAWRSYAKATLGTLFHKHGSEENARAALYDIEKYRKRPKIYDVHRTPAKQGLPEVKDEALRLGIDQPAISDRRRRKSLLTTKAF